MNTYDGKRIAFVREVCGIVRQEVAEKKLEQDVEKNENVTRHDGDIDDAIEILKKVETRKTKKVTSEPFVNALIAVIKERQQGIPPKSGISIEEKVTMKFGSAVTENIFYNDSIYIEFYLDVYQYLESENCLDYYYKKLKKRFVRLPGWIRHALSEDELIEMDMKFRESQEDGLKEIIHSFHEEGVLFVVQNWERLIQLGRYCSNADLPEFIADFKKTDFNKVMEKMNKECRLKPLELMENAIQYSFLTDLEFVPGKKARIGQNMEKRLDKLMEKERGIDLDYLAPVLENLDFITKENMNVLFKIACSMGGVVYGEGEIELDFEQD